MYDCVTENCVNLDEKSYLFTIKCFFYICVVYIKSTDGSETNVHSLFTRRLLSIRINHIVCFQMYYNLVL